MNDLSDACRTPPIPQSWESTFPNTVSGLMRTIESMREFLNRHSATPQCLYHAQVAAEEMGTNIIKYGYDDAREHRITLRVACLADCVRLELLDEGRPFDVRAYPVPDRERSLEDQPGGWGISLVRRLARRMDYERRDGMNVLTIEIVRD